MKNQFLITEKDFLTFQGPHRIRKREEKKEKKKVRFCALTQGELGFKFLPSKLAIKATHSTC